MSLFSLRSRRALSLSSSLLNGTKSFSSISSPPPLSSTIIPNPRINLAEKSHFLHLNQFQCRSFRSSTVSLSSRQRSPASDEEKISPDAILFEGCDYKHWLITMDFPKDPKPTPEEMVETYVQTAAKVLGSVEEAKKRIYACSTTTYHGFQVEVTEEESEKFRGLPGVVFILPDSYIDPVNKEYGGDKYEDGKITHRPPPVQYRRQGRYGDQNRRGGPYQQGGYENQGPNRNFGAQQNPQQPPQNYGPPGANVRRDPMPMGNNNNAPPIGQDSYQRERRDPVPPYQVSYPPPPPQGGNYSQGQGGGFGQGAGGGYGQGAGEGYGQGAGGGYRQGAGGGYGQGVGGSFGQGKGGVGGHGAGTGAAYGQGVGGSFGQGAGGNYGRGGAGGYGVGAGAAHGQGAGGAQGQGGIGGYGPGAGGSYGQGGVGGYGQGSSGGGYGQGGAGAHGQEGYSQGQNEFGQRDPRESGQGQQRSYAATGETGIGQGRY